MLHTMKKLLHPRSKSSRMLIPVLALLFLGVGVNAQAQKIRSVNTNAQSDDPVFREYRGIQIGMTADVARQKLGEPTEKVATQDFYVFSENETAQIFYDAQQKVKAISITYFGEGSGAPDCKAVLGTEIGRQADGSMHQLIKYPKAGYWVSYNRIAGESPVTTVVIQRLVP